MLKKLVSNTVAQLIAKFFGAGLTLLTTYFTIRLAGLPLYGDLSKILVLVAIGFSLIDFGLNAEAIRRKTPVSPVIFTSLLLSILVVVI
jgi:O-antigen/teichoic acid export membrane protein